jgi:hypothetical protein
MMSEIRDYQTRIDRLVPGDIICLNGVWRRVRQIKKHDEGDVSIWVDRRRDPALTAPAGQLVLVEANDE